MIVIPAACWQTMIDRFTGGQSGLHECVAFLDGVALGPEPTHGGVVTTVTLPDADRQPGGWRVEAGRMSAAGQHLRGYKLVRLAQVHAHPGRSTRHSEIDDRLAYSQRPGTISIVLPTHAVTHPGLGDAGVHLRERDGWRELLPQEVGRHVEVVPSLLDQRTAQT
jgi:hypothetical protein